LPLGEAGQSEYVRKIRDLRKSSTGITTASSWTTRPKKFRERHRTLEHQAQSRENDLLRALRELPLTSAKRNSGSPTPIFAGKAAGRPSGRDCAGRILFGRRSAVAAVVTRETIEIIPLTLVSRVARLLHLLRSAFEIRNGHRLYAKARTTLAFATWSHLETPVQGLIAPLRVSPCAACDHRAARPAALSSFHAPAKWRGVSGRCLHGLLCAQRDSCSVSAAAGCG